MKRHSTNLVSLVFGLIFLSVVGWWVARRYIHYNIDVPNVGWIAASVLILLGVLGVAASLRRGDQDTARPDRSGSAATRSDATRSDATRSDTTPSDTIEGRG